jgi:hypothetical protein
MKSLQYCEINVLKQSVSILNVGNTEPPLNVHVCDFSASSACYVFLFSPIRATYPAHLNPPRLDYSNCTWRRVQIMKFLVMQFFSFSCHLTSKYPLQHPVLKHPQPIFLP